jgi:hypothetical protein
MRIVSVVGVLGAADDRALAVVGGWMSRPVHDRGRVLRAYPAINEQENYYATQLFSCIVRKSGYDGIRFSSSAREGGTNFAIFDPYSLDVVNTRLERV